MTDSDFFDEVLGSDGKLDDDAEGEATWWPKKDAAGGILLAGTLVKGWYQPGFEGNGVSAVIQVKDRETGDLFNVNCGTKLLSEYIINEAPAEGALLVVQYDGLVTAEKSGRQFKKYIMRVDGKPDFDYWHKLFQAYHKKQQMGAVEAGFEQSSDGGSFGPSDAPF